MGATHRIDAYAGILLAAGRGSRFDPTGARSKLMQPLRDSESIAAASARNLLTVLPSVLAVVRPDGSAISQQLRALGCRVTVCETADEGMAASLVHALSEARDARGWIIALADMPYVQPNTIRVLVEAVERGAHIAVPTYEGRRGNPVAFDRTHLDHLLALRGDAGARHLLRTFPVIEVATDDPGIAQDIDTPDDLPPGKTFTP